MLIFAIALFVLAAVFGLFALLAILKNQPTPKPAVFAHGAIAAIALILVIAYTVGAVGPAPMASMILFIIAALGGFALFTLDWQKKPIPKPLAFIHPIAAVIALILLIAFVFRG
ncbi:MAG: hypothetical protein ACM3YF_06485 [Candidatus Zixiibacteriota bacterium]|jgi:hypothetical protein